MPRYNIRTENPVRYAQVKAEQDRLRAECARSSSITLARLCPYCDHRLDGAHRHFNGQRRGLQGFLHPEFYRVVNADPLGIGQLLDGRVKNQATHFCQRRLVHGGSPLSRRLFSCHKSILLF